MRWKRLCLIKPGWQVIQLQKQAVEIAGCSLWWWGNWLRQLLKCASSQDLKDVKVRIWKASCCHCWKMIKAIVLWFATIHACQVNFGLQNAYFRCTYSFGSKQRKYQQMPREESAWRSTRSTEELWLISPLTASSTWAWYHRIDCIWTNQYICHCEFHQDSST